MLIDIDHVQIAAPPGSEPAARDFFSSVLGLPEVQKPPSLQAAGGCWFQLGPRQLHVGIDADFRAAGKAHVAVAASDLGELFRRLEAAGFACRWDDSVKEVRRFYSHDPWDNRIEFTEPTFRSET